MPIVKFDQPASLSDNSGSSRKFVEYLSKEDSWKGIEKEFFFNQESQFICDYEVIAAIDSNHKALCTEDAKFYTGSINFSEEELSFLNNDTAKIKQYSIEVMEQYASNFNKGLTINDINWFAKLETNRYYKGDDPDVINGQKKQGDIKPGNNLHIHFIIGRKSKDNRLKLSPVTNHQNTLNGPVKGGFSRDAFKEKCESLFDRKFLYNRPFENSYKGLKLNKNGKFADKENFMSGKATLQSERIKYSQLEGAEKIAKLDKLINYIQFGINRESPTFLDNERLLVQEVQYSTNGSVYQALMNLSIKMKNGYQPDPSTIMDTILKNASDINDLKTSNKIEQDFFMDEAFIPKFTNVEQNPDLDISVLNVADNFIPRPHKDDDLAEYLRKKKKKQDRNRGSNFNR